MLESLGGESNLFLLLGTTRWTSLGGLGAFKFDYCTGDISRAYGAVCILYSDGSVSPPCVYRVRSVAFRDKNLREEYLSDNRVTALSNEFCRHVVVFGCRLSHNSGVNRELCKYVEYVTEKTLFV